MFLDRLQELVGDHAWSTGQAPVDVWGTTFRDLEAVAVASHRAQGTPHTRTMSASETLVKQGVDQLLPRLVGGGADGVQG